MAQSEILQKLKSLEDQVQLGEATRQEMRDKLRIADDSNKELAKFIRSLQTQSDGELSSMRQFLQQKVNEDMSVSQKFNEKNSILFNELVRLGKDTEANQ